MRIPLLATVAALTLALLLSPLPAAAQAAQAPPTGTPKEMVATYNGLADGILALKKTEDSLVRSILAATLAHGQGQLARAQHAIQANDAKAAGAAVEALAADVGQLATEGDNAVGAVRKRLLEGGHHHNAAGEAQGLYEEGYVVVTRKAKAQLLESSRAIAGMAAAPKAEGLAAEWKKVEGLLDGLLKSGK
ncbi:MAG TPA: hypothetical protein VMX54_11305 [Vicinamibacteria bacterium]|nr:hypothetical protein [Vicinamibacteria bacterium]